MGLGKTLQSISILGFMQEYREVSGPHLVLVPKSTLANWMNEFGRWCPSLRAVRFHGDKHERQDIVRDVLRPGGAEEDRSWDVLVTTYEVANMEVSSLAKFAWKYLIIDEAHRIKNETSKFSQTIRALKTENRLLITGTPLQNNLHELWALLNYMLPDEFENAEQFDSLFNLDIDDAEAKASMISTLHKVLRPFMLRRLKADVEKSLPPKTEMMIFTGMAPMQRELYKKILRREVDTVNGGGSASSKTALLNIVMQLRKACNHPYLFEGMEDRKLDPLGEHLVTNCGKMVLLDKLLLKMKERGHRVLIFSQMTRMLDILEDFLIMRQYESCRIDGDTTYDERERLIDAYNAPGSTKFVFLLSTRAGGLGINLQTADTVVLYDSDWNPQSDLQAMDRAHRIGQKKAVHVYRLVTEFAIEEKVVTRAQQKLKLDAMVVQQGQLANKDKLSKDELMDAVRFGAEKVFRSTDDGVTDEDIDIILDRGKKKTEEMMNKLSEAEKGDMLDFKLDGGMNAQTFEGQDYSAEGRRLQAPVIDKMLLLEEECATQRVRKPVANYNEAKMGLAYGDQDRPKKPKKPKSKLPEALRVPAMQPWMFYQAPRLLEIHQLEEQQFVAQQESGALTPEAAQTVTTEQLLGAEVAHEKAKLLAEGFPKWHRQLYADFVRALVKVGHENVGEVAVMLEKDEEEVKRYCDAFFAKGPMAFGETEWARLDNQIQRGNKKREEIQKLEYATRKVFERFQDPWQELTLSYGVGRPAAKEFTSSEDRCLLCLAHTYGHGNWDAIRTELYRVNAVQPEVQVDYYLLAAGNEAIARRCEFLMRLCEKEVAEEEVKQQGANGGGDGDVAAKKKQAEEANEQAILLKAAEVAADRAAAIEALSAKVEAEKAALAAAKALHVDLEAVTPSDDEAGALAGLEKRAKDEFGIVIKNTATAAAAPHPKGLSALFDKAYVAPGSSSSSKQASSSSKGGASSSSSKSAAAASKPPPKAKATLSEDLAEALASLAVGSGLAGAEKVADQFKEQHVARHLTKREIKDWLDLHLFRDPKAGWRWRTDSEKAKATAAADSGGGKGALPSKSGGEKRKSGGSGSAPTSNGKVAKSDGSKQTNKGGSPNKRKSGSGASSSSSSSSSQQALKPPKKSPAARTIYFKAKRAEVREGMRAVDGEGATSQSAEDELLKRWGLLPPEEVLTFEAQARVEADRYNRELKAYREALAAQEREASKATAAGHASKKAKRSDAAAAGGASGGGGSSEFAIPKKSSSSTSTSSAPPGSPGGTSPSPTKAPSFSIPKKAKPAPAEKEGVGAGSAPKP